MRNDLFYPFSNILGLDLEASRGYMWTVPLWQSNNWIPRYNDLPNKLILEATISFALATKRLECIEAKVTKLRENQLFWENPGFPLLVPFASVKFVFVRYLRRRNFFEMLAECFEEPRTELFRKAEFFRKPTLLQDRCKTGMQGLNWPSKVSLMMVQSFTMALLSIAKAIYGWKNSSCICLKNCCFHKYNTKFENRK